LGGVLVLWIIDDRWVQTWSEFLEVAGVGLIYSIDATLGARAVEKFLRGSYAVLATRYGKPGPAAGMIV
jgi:hypothetical protein